jgi:type VI protein secretion system component VasF
MNSEIASVMDRVLLCGLDLKNRLEQGEKLDIAVEQTQLRTLLKSESESRRWPEYGGDSAIGGTTIGGQRAQAFAGIRYALTSWLDEIFIADSRWSEEWRDKALELDLYGEVLRYDRFWEQARRAESRPGTDALEGYFLCTMLGFRGRNVGAPEQLQAWCDSVEPRITSGYDRGYDLPAARMPPCNVPPLVGRDKLRKLMVIGAILAGYLLLVASFVLVSLPNR